MPRELSKPVDAVRPLFLLENLGRRLREEFEKAVAHLGLTAKHYRIITMVALRGPMTQQHIGRLLGIDRTTMVKLVDDLERLGLAFRDRHPTDGRAWEIDLTPEGEIVLNEAAQLAHSTELNVLSSLDDDSRQSIIRLLSFLG